MLDCEKLFAAFPKLKFVDGLAARHRFHQWFAGRGGFDLVLGNSPWVKVEWEESGSAATAHEDFQPTIAHTTEIHGRSSVVMASSIQRR